MQKTRRGSVASFDMQMSTPATPATARIGYKLLLQFYLLQFVDRNIISLIKITISQCKILMLQSSYHNFGTTRYNMFGSDTYSYFFRIRGFRYLALKNKNGRCHIQIDGKLMPISFKWDPSHLSATRGFMLNLSLRN